MQKQLLEDYPAFCTLKLDQINKKNLQEFVNNLVRDGYSPKSIRNRYGLITAVMKANDFNPPSVTLPDRVPHEPSMPTDKEILHLLESVKGYEVEIPVKLALFGGLRRGEIAALGLEDIEDDTVHNEAVIHVRADIVQTEFKTYFRKAPKNYTSYRTVRIPIDLAQQIRSKGCVSHFTNPHAITSAFERAAKRANLEGLRFHDLRHWHASYLHSLGIPDAEIQERCGWSSDYVMKNVYRHSLSDSKRKSNQKMLNSFQKFL